MTSIRIVADARESLVSSLPNEAGGVREALWTRSALIGRMLHEALVCEAFYGSVERALESLTPEQREVVVLKVYQGFKFHEIAEIVSCPVSTVKSRLYSAFGALKTTLAPVGRTA